MKKTTKLTIGIDLGDRKHAICIIDQNGDIIHESMLSNTREDIARFLKNYPESLIAMEVGMHSPWLSRFLKSLGYRVIVANPRKLRAIYENPRKSDKKDALMLAKLARADESLLSPIEHRSEKAQRDLLQIKLRDNLVRQRVNIISSVRFILKSLGIKTKSPKTSYFTKHLRREIEDDYPEILVLVEPSLLVIDQITEQVKELDKAIETLAAEQYPETQLISQITGVGALTSLTFVLTIEDPKRFKRGRDVGSYLGLVPKRDQSGETDKELRISKAGDRYLRTLLVNAAHYVLGPFGPDCELKRHGLKLAERGGSRAKKKAAIAIARKLSVLMLTLWKNQSVYELERTAA